MDTTRTVWMVDGSCSHGTGGSCEVTIETALEAARLMLTGEGYRGPFCDCAMGKVTVQAKVVPDCGQFAAADAKAVSK